MISRCLAYIRLHKFTWKRIVYISSLSRHNKALLVFEFRGQTGVFPALHDKLTFLQRNGTHSAPGKSMIPRCRTKSWCAIHYAYKNVILCYCMRISFIPAKQFTVVFYSSFTYSFHWQIEKCFLVNHKEYKSTLY